MNIKRRAFLPSRLMEIKQRDSFFSYRIFMSTLKKKKQIYPSVSVSTLFVLLASYIVRSEGDYVCAIDNEQLMKRRTLYKCKSAQNFELWWLVISVCIRIRWKVDCIHHGGRRIVDFQIIQFQNVSPQSENYITGTEITKSFYFCQSM